jgi:hypothetical protein
MGYMINIPSTSNNISAISKSKYDVVEIDYVRAVVPLRSTESTGTFISRAR